MIRTKTIRHFATFILGCLLCAQAYAQHTTEFQFSETAPDNIKKIMQTNAEAVFAEINRACDQNKAGLSLLPANVTDEAGKRIRSLWANSHFYCIKTSIKEMVLKLSNGYMVRNIPVFIEQGNKLEDKYQDMAIEFNESGKISDLYIALSQGQYDKIMSNSKEMSDLRQRQIILEFAENFRMAYNRKDMEFFQTVYSDDALIITGKVPKQDKTTDCFDSTLTKTHIEYVVQNKEQYLKNLKRVFASNSYINVKFDETTVKQHESNPNIYGVTYKQNWNSLDGYHDEGWLFYIVDFSKGEENPIIWKREWYPTTDPKTGQEIHYSTEDIFNMSDFPMIQNKN